MWRRPQFGNAALPRVEGLAGLQPPGRGVAYEIGRHEIAFAEPQGNDVGVAEHGHRHFRDGRIGHAGSGAAQRGNDARRDKSGLTLHALDVAHRLELRQPSTCPTIVGGQTKPD